MSEKTDVAHDPSGTPRAEHETAPAACTAASRLLTATDIWSSTPVAQVVEAPPPAPQPSPQPPATGAVAPMAAQPIKRPAPAPAPLAAPSASYWPPRKLSLALQGGGTFAAFTWGVLERLLEELGIEFDTISGASAGAINALLLACGLAEGGREAARARLDRFWVRLMHEASFRSLMLVGGFSPAGSSVAFGPTLRSGHFDPFDLDPLRHALSRDINFVALHEATCPKLLVAATRIRDGHQQVFSNDAITADVALASICPPLVHCAIEIDGEAYWDGGYGANPPLVRLIQESRTSDVLVVQVTPSRDSYVPITLAAIDRRLDQITANAVFNAELAAVEWARAGSAPALRLFRIAAEDDIEGLAQRSSTDLGRGFIRLLHRSGRAAAERWLRRETRSEPSVQRTPAEPALV